MVLNYQRDFDRGIAEGRIEGQSSFNGIGEVDGANGNNIDMWLGGTDVQPEPVPAGFQPNVISSDVGDAAGGIGIQSVDVHYLDTDGVQQVESVPTNGTTQVNMTATNVMFVQDPHTSADSIGSNLVAVGNVDVRNGITVVGRIEAAGNRSLSSMRQIPAGKKLLIDSWRCGAVSAAGGKLARIRLRSTIDPDGVPTPGIYLFNEPAVVIDNNTPLLLLKRPVVVPELMTVKISVWTTGAMECAGSWFGILKNA